MTNTNSTKSIAVYGATGHTGGYLLAELRRRELIPTLVGRNVDRLRAAATAADLTDADIRVAALDDHDAMVAAFRDADVVISSLPAYVTNGEAVLSAAIDADAHYTDLSGEQLFVHKVFQDYSARAEAAGITLVPAVTDSNLPGDLLGHLTSRRVGGGADITISHHSKGEGDGSRGSAQTVLASVDWFREGGWHYAHGSRQTGRPQVTELRYPADELKPAAKFPVTPVLTIPRHSEVASVTGLLPGGLPEGLAALTAEIVATLPATPDPAADMRYDLVVDAEGPDKSVRGVLSGLDSYRDSALMAVEAAVRLAANTTKPGALAAAEAFDAEDFLDALAPHGITWRIELL
ncbi:NAD(P)H-binding protein [Nocardia cyriacigeorgica]|uniref:NAD(P)H-binding protein n=1 Tax=Nocardia cyriacigeorgica TaxID=135487 RepID=A0A6P1DFC0_9NOCA|nr:saccharopine dehydrogenase NADP-binding domain-containing protein [Nocardia cyriacigeorgica]NEW38724.1 NAD(P)H-binding protein [Nocardia cyriacigeorgica]NEW47884.1 NAD(P)H-binding protein [Nocardia cyriacigeorgica]NEW53882.1 NAD(P)H-binding protein [Nocardia cyriacigeorgica]NEW59306.1 NAD(P)H-binding protein [Nocardia cyriacigeorgica]